MTVSEDNSDRPDEDLYLQSVMDHAQLQNRLPNKAVVSLAREVLNRLAQDLKEQEKVPEDVEQLARALYAQDAMKAAEQIKRHLQNGVSAKTLYRPYLARAAQKLGELWETDEVTFAELTVGIGRIYAIMRTLRDKIKPTGGAESRSAVFATVPGDDHTLGIRMAAELARKDGWDVALKVDLSHDELVDEITQSGKLLVGISAGGEHSLPDLARLVLALRINLPEALILVSGHAADVANESISLLHVDAIAHEYDEAMATLDDLWASLQSA
ncbi:MAG: cobalamin-dependent protein [Pseudomonadota bacterium]